jgi:hypothetical protein
MGKILHKTMTALYGTHNSSLTCRGERNGMHEVDEHKFDKAEFKQDTFGSSSSSVLTRPSGPHSRPTTSQTIW